MFRSIAGISVAALIIVIIVGVYFAFRWTGGTQVSRSLRLGEWFLNKNGHPDWAIQAGERCGDAPFIMPTDGYIGFLWGDSFRPTHSHQGIDIFGGGEVGKTPVLVAYSGYLTRLPDWKSSVILRLPDDPLQPGRQIWTYYTHMADKGGNSYIDAEFPPGTREVFVEAGTLLGYQGNYSGDPFNPTGVHLHFSVVLDDGQGSFRNELDIRNTLDPSPYLGLPLNANQNRDQVPVCDE
jgi:murein DD-endopeptidase MepM/ murein hydrolase activator NlpD